MICKHVIVSGRVQGVGFRYWVAREAEGLGITGWVRNLADGRVEAVFSVDQSAVGEMLARLQMGPRLANVSDLAVSDAAPADFAGFEIRPTR